MSRMRLRPEEHSRPVWDRDESVLSCARSLVLMLVLASTIGAGWATGAAAADEPRLLLLPVVVHSAEDPGYLRDGLADMLASRFSRIGSIDLVRPDADSRGTTDRVRAIALARKVDADYVLFGSFTRFGQGASLDVQCAPVSEDKQRTPLREIFVHSGSIGEIIPDLDELAGKVSRFVRGESVYPAAPGLGGAPLAAASSDELPSDSQIEDLEYRIEALEAALTELLEIDAGVETDSETGTDEELR